MTNHSKTMCSGNYFILHLKNWYKSLLFLVSTFLEFLPLLECNGNRQELFSHYQKCRCHLELHSLQFLVVALYICFIRWVHFASFHVRRAPSYSHNICIFFYLLDSFSCTLLLRHVFQKKLSHLFFPIRSLFNKGGCITFLYTAVSGLDLQSRDK